MAVKYHGKRGVVYVSVSGAVAAVNVGGMRGFTLDLATDLVDVTEFQLGPGGNKQFVQGYPNFTGDINGFWASDVTILQQAAIAADGTNIYLYPSSDAPSKYVGGPAWLNYTISGAVDAAVVQTAHYSARGIWTNNL